MRVQLDLLAGEPEGTGEDRHHQRAQDVMARRIHGCDLAFEQPVETTIEGTHLGGGKDCVRVRVAAIAPFLAMKGIVLDNRLNPKDAYDIYYCVLHYPGGIESLIAEIRPFLRHVLAREGLAIIARHFASADHLGPRMVTDFLEITDREELERVRRDAYERVNHVLKELDIGQTSAGVELQTD